MRTEFNYPEATRGETIEALRVTLKWDETDDPVDLTDAKIWVQFRAGTACGAVVRSFDEDNGITIIDALNGVFEIDEFDATFPEGDTYVYDIDVTLSDQLKRTPVYGTLVLIQDVTR